MKKSNVKYSIIIPAYHEEEVIGSSLDALAKYMTKNHYMDEGEVIVVTADTDDKTHQIVKSKAGLFKSFIHIKPGPRVGKGRDVRAGILAASGQYIVFTDADLATPLHHIKRAFKGLEKNTDIVIGVRDLKVIHTGTRKFVSLTANKLTRLLIAPSVRDTQCGFKAFRHDVAKDIFSRLSVLGWAFDMEVIAIARASKYKIVQMEVHDWSEPKAEDSQLTGDNSITSAFTTLGEALKIGMNRLTGRYRA